MLSFPAAIKVYLCTVPCDMRRSFDGLSMMAEHVIRLQPLFGAPTGFLQPPHRPLEDFVLGSRRLGDMVQAARGRHFSISFFRNRTKGNRRLGAGSAAGR